MKAISTRVLAIIVTLVVGSAATLGAADGASLYDKRCASCHAKDGSGKTPAGSKMHIPDLRSKEVRDKSDSELYNTVAKGTKHKNYPHAFLYTGMTKGQIQDVVGYIRTLK
jgi:mono/diheme cytochrome c family protein